MLVLRAGCAGPGLAPRNAAAAWAAGRAASGASFFREFSPIKCHPNLRRLWTLPVGLQEAPNLEGEPPGRTPELGLALEQERDWEPQGGCRSPAASRAASLQALPVWGHPAPLAVSPGLAEPCPEKHTQPAGKLLGAGLLRELPPGARRSHGPQVLSPLKTPELARLSPSGEPRVSDVGVISASVPGSFAGQLAPS